MAKLKEITRRQVVKQNEVEKLVELFNEYKDDESPAARICRQWKARGLSKWSKAINTAG